MHWPWWVSLIVATSVAQVFVIAYFVRRTYKRWAEIEQREAHIRATGEAGTALVTEINDTGRQFGPNDHPIVQLRLQVEPARGLPFDTTLEARLSPVRIGNFTEGKRIAVRIDPLTQAVAIDQRTQ